MLFQHTSRLLVLSSVYSKFAGALLPRIGPTLDQYVPGISLVTSRVGLRQKEPQTAHAMSITWASHIAVSVLTGR